MYEITFFNGKINPSFTAIKKGLLAIKLEFYWGKFWAAFSGVYVPNGKKVHRRVQNNSFTSDKRKKKNTNIACWQPGITEIKSIVFLWRLFLFFPLRSILDHFTADITTTFSCTSCISKRLSAKSQASNAWQIPCFPLSSEETANEKRSFGQNSF